MIDTNILFDYLCDRKPFADEAQTLFRLCEIKEVQGFISSLSITNIIHILCKELTINKTKEIFSKLQLLFNIVDLKAIDLQRATQTSYKDFDDAIQEVTAQRIGANCLITRNKKDYKQSKVPVYTPTEFYSLIYND